MSSIDDGELYLAVEDASEDQLRRGIAAARASFEQSGVSIEDAFVALAERVTMFDLATPQPVTETHYRNVAAFDVAVTAAMTATRADPFAFIDFGQWLEAMADDVQLDCGPHYEIVRPDPRQIALAL